MRYPIRIRFWYWVHDRAESLWHWVHRTKLAPWHAAQSFPRMSPKYHLVETRDPTDEEKARGVVATKIYVSTSPL